MHIKCFATSLTDWCNKKVMKFIISNNGHGWLFWILQLNWNVLQTLAQAEQRQHPKIYTEQTKAYALLRT